jgi:sulfatase modifying factor 1
MIRWIAFVALLSFACSTHAQAPPPFNFADEAKTSAQARESQEAWAKSLGVKVVETNSIGMKMTLLPPGEFLMGITPEAAKIQIRKFKVPASAFDDERPQHRVRLTKPFRMAAHEVTVAQFRAFVAAKSYVTDAEKTTSNGGDGIGGWGYDDATKSLRPALGVSWRNPGYTQSDSHPVVNVSRNDVLAFVKWLNEKEGTTKYRLPTEAEWEYACRAGTKSYYQTGNDPEDLARVGNLGDTSFSELFSGIAKDRPLIRANDGYIFAAPVGQFRSNGFGLYDLHGNVWEWLADEYVHDLYEKYDVYEETKNGIRENPEVKDILQNTSFVLRGGSWFCAPWVHRSSGRFSFAPSHRTFDAGFRLAMTH